jgi:hypothetical protein
MAVVLGSSGHNIRAGVKNTYHFKFIFVLVDVSAVPLIIATRISALL